MGFSLFGPYHFGWLVVSFLTVFFVSRYFKSLDGNRRIILQQIIAWFILLFEIYKDMYLISRNEFSIEYLPLELCSFAIFAIFYHAYTNSLVVGEMLYNLFLPGTIAALLFCNWTFRSVYDFMSIFSFVFHIAVLVYCVMVLYAEIVKPTIKRVWGSLLFLAMTVPIIYPLNKIWETNFMFLNVPSPGSPLVPLENMLGNPGYILGMIVIIVILWIVLYLPWKKWF